MKDTNKLYEVKLRGFSGWGTGVVKDINYVVATDPSSAYKKIRDRLDELNYGYHGDRELDLVELVAEEKDYADCKARLFT